MNSQTGELHIISTPIGNLKDITIRALETLYNVDILLCEDTRTTKKMMDRYIGILHDKSKDIHKTPKLIPYHEHNEIKLNDKVIYWLKEGKSIGLVSEAGTPLISDPGYKLTRECIKNNIRIIEMSS